MSNLSYTNFTNLANTLSEPLLAKWVALTPQSLVNSDVTKVTSKAIDQTKLT
jgi:hypothetical protein